MMTRLLQLLLSFGTVSGGGRGSGEVGSRDNKTVDGTYTEHQKKKQIA